MSHILVVNDGLSQLSVCDVDEGKKKLKIKKNVFIVCFVHQSILLHRKTLHIEDNKSSLTHCYVNLMLISSPHCKIFFFFFLHD